MRDGSGILLRGKRYSVQPDPEYSGACPKSTYDKNGNILILSRNTHGGGTDTFSYTYDDGNRLLSVSGSKTATYTYDANGNMLSDSSKGVTSISYNHLDLPETVTFASGDVIAYLYDAVGNKLKKTVTQGGNTSVTEYWDGFQYLQDNLQFFAQPEGYIAVNEDVATSARTFSYVYSYTDHLGNVRLSYSDLDGDGSITVAEIVKESNYYPFGLRHKGYNNTITGRDHKYGFNGFEEQEELGLNWLDFTARNYDPAIGRWMNIDPLAEAMRRHSLSPFAAMGNNPIIFVDPNGEELVTALIAGAVVGAWLGGATAIATGADFNDIGRAILFGGISGLVTAGIGQAFSGPGAVLASSPGAQVVAQAGAHGLAQGALSAAQGGNFGTGFISGALSSGVASGLESFGTLAQIGGAGFTGGITAELSGDDFGNGFVRGITIATLNHAMHGGFRKAKQDPCPECPDPNLRRAAIMMAEHAGGDAQDYYDAMVDDNFIPERIADNVADVANVATAGEAPGVASLFRNYLKKRFANIFAKKVVIKKAVGAAPKGFSKFKSINQLNKLVQTGKLPKTITRFDKGKILGELDHVHFSNGAALNINGTWKHGSKVLTNKEIKILTQNGWTLPK